MTGCWIEIRAQGHLPSKGAEPQAERGLGDPWVQAKDGDSESQQDRGLAWRGQASRGPGFFLERELGQALLPRTRLAAEALFAPTRGCSTASRDSRFLFTGLLIKV